MTPSLIHMKRTPMLLLALVALAAAGCGSSNKSSSSSSSSPAPATTTSSSSTSGGTAAPSSGKTVTIDMKNIQFNPKTVTVKVGTTVKWVNQDSAPHNVTGGPLHSPTFGNGGSFTYKAAKAGKISYVCTIHPGMTATLNVTS
jgi:plastocyanin